MDTLSPPPLADPAGLEALSRVLSRVLRHDPGQVGIALDRAGWVAIDTLIAALNRRPPGVAKRVRTLPVVTRALLAAAVASNTKQRFELSADGERLRAAQGHSVEVDLGLPATAPPEFLYHGTVAQALPGIRREGLQPGRRQDVHLSGDRPTAVAVGRRRGTPVVLTVRAGDLAALGHRFRQAANGEWLTDHVPPAYLRFPGRAGG